MVITADTVLQGGLAVTAAAALAVHVKAYRKLTFVPFPGPRLVTELVVVMVVMCVACGTCLGLFAAVAVGWLHA